jgi:hypothetical protein
MSDSISGESMGGDMSDSISNESKGAVGRHKVSRGQGVGRGKVSSGIVHMGKRLIERSG